MTYGSLSGSRIGPFNLALNTTLAYKNEYNSGIWFFFFFFFFTVRCYSILLKIWYIMMGKINGCPKDIGLKKF